MITCADCPLCAVDLDRAYRRYQHLCLSSRRITPPPPFSLWFSDQQWDAHHDHLPTAEVLAGLVDRVWSVGEHRIPVPLQVRAGGDVLETTATPVDYWVLTVDEIPVGPMKLNTTTMTLISPGGEKKWTAQAAFAFPASIPWEEVQRHVARRLVRAVAEDLR